MLCVCVAGGDDLDQIGKSLYIETTSDWLGCSSAFSRLVYASVPQEVRRRGVLFGVSVGGVRNGNPILPVYTNPPWVYTTPGRIGLPLPETCSLQRPAPSKFIALSSVSARWPVSRSSQGFSRIHHVSCLHIVQAANMMPGISFQSVFGANLLNRHAANILACDCKKWPESRCIFIHATRHKKCFSFLFFLGPTSFKS